MTAAIYTARKKLKTLLLTKQLGGQMVWSADVENYAGFSLITGVELTLKFEEHLKSIKEDLEVKDGTEVVRLEKNVKSFQVDTADGTAYYARAIIIASGKNPRRLGIPGEDKFFGHGVAVCATCDAPLYKNKDVAVIGGGNSAMDAILSLSKVARRIYSVNLNSELVGDNILKDKIHAIPSVKFFNSTKTVEIVGDQRVSGLRLEPAGQAEQVVPVHGVFIEIGYEPSHAFDALTVKNQRGEIKVDQNLQTSVPGIFAAGDINDAWGEQIVIAAGEGAKAAMACADYLNRLR